MKKRKRISHKPKKYDVVISVTAKGVSKKKADALKLDAKKRLTNARIRTTVRK
ncbi:MAG: hypothetical protein KAJ39_07780 [Gammaproteobacteria bacterium]|nr:hypothetical protein [Gammaproteobacteria bacterium]